MKTIITISIMFLMFTCVPAQAEWNVSYNDFLKHYTVSNGEKSITFKKEESAKKAAKTLNKAEKKGELVGVWDDGTGNCDRPGVNC